MKEDDGWNSEEKLGPSSTCLYKMLHVELPSMRAEGMGGVVIARLRTGLLSEVGGRGWGRYHEPPRRG